MKYFGQEETYQRDFNHAESESIMLKKSINSSCISLQSTLKETNEAKDLS